VAASIHTRATTRPIWKRRPSAWRFRGAKDAKLHKRLKDELEWVRSNAKGRRAKSKARLARYEEMAAEAERTRKLDFEENPNSARSAVGKFGFLKPLT
jgi:ATPase subunit of ABC transporter with duplicated ATPase domains